MNSMGIDKTPARVRNINSRKWKIKGIAKMPYAPYSVPTGRSTSLASMLKVEVAVDTTIYCRVRRGERRAPDLTYALGKLD